VSVFIDSAGVTDDTAAIAHVTSQAAELHAAPANVAHTQRLMHRTDESDRDIHTVGPVRGGGAPMA